MKNTKECPKCHGREILRIPGKHEGSGAGNIIFMGMTAMNAVKVDRLVCTNCGFVEEWIQNEKDIERLKNKYPYL